MVGDYENLKIDDLVIHFTINDQLFLEKLLTEIRGKTIAYASYQKKRKNRYNEIRK